MNWFIVFTIFAVASALSTAFSFWLASDSSGDDAFALIGIWSLGWTILWAALAAGAYFA